MAELKTFWTDPGMPMSTDLGGDSITSSGSDPQVTVDSPNGLTPIWANPIVPTPSGAEDSNSVSGLPATPNRFEPSATPPDPPDLKDRRPGTIEGT